MVEMPKEFVPEHVMDEPKTFTGNRALSIEEPLIFEIGSPETSGVDFEDPLTLSLSRKPPGELATFAAAPASGCGRGIVRRAV